MVVSINGITYDKIMDAVFVAENGQTVKLESDMTEDVEITNGRRITFDLNGFTLKNVVGPTIRIAKKSVLNITDSNARKQGAVDSILNAFPAVVVEAGAMLTMDKAKLTRSLEDGSSNSAYILNNMGVTVLRGTANITGTSTKFSTVKNGFDTDIPAETAMLHAEDSDYTAVLSIEGGTVGGTKGAVINVERSRLNVNGGSVTCNDTCVYNLGSCHVSGGTITSTTKSPITSGAFMGSDGGVFVTGGTLNSAGGQPIFATVTAPDVTAPANPEVSGGTYSEKFPVEYLVPGFAFGGAGGLQVISLVWVIRDAGVGGVGFSGHRKLIVSKDKVKYTNAGITVPVPLQDAILVSVNVKGGAVGYYDRTSNKVTLYRGGKELANPTDLEDITLVFLEL